MQATSCIACFIEIFHIRLVDDRGRGAKTKTRFDPGSTAVLIEQLKV